MLFMPLSAYLGESAEEKYVSCQAGKDTELDIIQRETKAGVGIRLERQCAGVGILTSPLLITEFISEV